MVIQWKQQEQQVWECDECGNERISTRQCVSSVPWHRPPTCRSWLSMHRFVSGSWGARRWPAWVSSRVEWCHRQFRRGEREFRRGQRVRKTFKMKIYFFWENLTRQAPLYLRPQYLVVVRSRRSEALGQARINARRRISKRSVRET